MDIKTAKKAALEGIPVVLTCPGREPIKYSHISAIIFKPKDGKLMTSLELADMVKGVTVASIEYTEVIT